MIIAGKIVNGQVNIVKDFFKRFREEDLVFYGYEKINIPEGCEDYSIEDIGTDLRFDVDKYNKRKAEYYYKQYEYDIVKRIRERYSIDQELAILRQRDSKPEEFYEYNTYVEKCKAEIKAKYNL